MHASNKCLRGAALLRLESRDQPPKGGAPGGEQHVRARWGARGGGELGPRELGGLGQGRGKGPGASLAPQAPAREAWRSSEPREAAGRRDGEFRTAIEPLFLLVPSGPAAQVRHEALDLAGRHGRPGPLRPRSTPTSLSRSFAARRAGAARREAKPPPSEDRTKQARGSSPGPRKAAAAETKLIRRPGGFSAHARRRPGGAAA